MAETHLSDGLVLLSDRKDNYMGNSSHGLGTLKRHNGLRLAQNAVSTVHVSKL